MYIYVLLYVVRLLSSWQSSPPKCSTQCVIDLSFGARDLLAEATFAFVPHWGLYRGPQHIIELIHYH